MTGVCVTYWIIPGIVSSDLGFVGVLPNGGSPTCLEDPCFTHTKDLVIANISTYVVGTVRKRTELGVCHRNTVQCHTARVLDGVFPGNRIAHLNVGTCSCVCVLAIRRLLNVNSELPNRHILVTSRRTSTHIGHRHIERGRARTPCCPGDLVSTLASGDRPIAGDPPVVGGSCACVYY